MICCIVDQSQFADIFASEFTEFLHFVLAVFAVVVLEVEFLGEEGVQFDCVEQVVEVDPLGATFLVQFVLLECGYHCFAVGAHQVAQCFMAVLCKFFRTLHLELDNDLLLEQEVFQVLVRDTLYELLPDW